MPFEDSKLLLAISDLVYRARIYRSCITCEHFDEQNELCLLGGINQRPPARVIALGCDNYFEVPPF